MEHTQNSGTWAEFSFNNMKNKTTGKCPFNVVYTKALRLTFDIANLPTGVDIQNVAEEMANRVQKLHKEVYDHLIKNTSYKEDNDEKKSSLPREDLVMTHLRRRRFSTGTYGKLKDKQVSPCKALAKYDPNAYKIELLEDLNTNSVSNVVDLKKYHAPDEYQC